MRGIDRPVYLYDPEVGDNVYRPLYEVASSKLARKTHVDMLNKLQINYYDSSGLNVPPVSLSNVPGISL